MTRSALLVLAALLFAQSSARADDDRVKRADRLFRDGQRFLKQGKFTEACASFAESQRLDPAVGTLLNLADCHAQVRRFATARAEFEEAARLAAEVGQRERESFAKDQLKQLDALLSFVTIKFDGPADVVTIDGKAANVAGAIPLDPGPHEFHFASPGRIAKTVRFEVANGPSAQTLEAPRLDPEPRIVAPVEPPRPPPKREDPRRVAAIATAGAGGVALIVGTYFGLHAASKKSDAEPHCNGKYCDPDGLSLQDDAHSAATVSTIAFGLGILALGAGAYLYFTSQRSLHVAPALNGARLEARW